MMPLIPELPSAVVLIPAFNESGLVGAVVRQVIERAQLPVVVINDASSDDTAAEAEQAGATVIDLPVKLGAWGATQTGIRYARREGYTVVVTMDADGQHEAAYLEKLMRPVLSGQADVAIGACTSRGSRLRRIAWVLMKHSSGLSMEDITSGFRVYNELAIRELSRRRANLLDYQDIGVLLLLLSRGARIVDVEVAMPPRQGSGSRIFHSWQTVAYYMIHSLMLGIAKRNPRLED
jgi:glycosyltransferase involved in cell wall biosynthesis